MKIVLGGKTGFGEVLTPFSRITSCYLVCAFLRRDTRLRALIIIRSFAGGSTSRSFARVDMDGGEFPHFLAVTGVRVRC